MLISRANPWICLGLAFAWLAIAALSPPPEGFVPSLSQIVTSQFILHFLLLGATVFTAATAPRDSGAKTNPFAWTFHVFGCDILRGFRRAAFLVAMRKGLVAGAAMVILSGAISSALNFVAKSAGNELELQPVVGIILRSAWPAKVVLLVSVIALSPISEELFFRYALESSLAGTLSSRTRAVSYAALLFAGMHGTLSAFPSLLLVAAICSYVYRRAGSIAAPIAAHMLFNFVSVAVILLGGAE